MRPMMKDVTTSDLSPRFAQRLRETGEPDGGWGPRPGVPSEPEPTALAAIALADAGARAWLGANQRDDGSVGMGAGDVMSDSATALAAIALGRGPGRERALDHIVAWPARTIPHNDVIPMNPRFHGWAWTENTFGWVEPTARAVIALRMLRPTATAAIEDGLAMLRDRECVGGGWNYGNRIAFGEELPPYAETTAIALLALGGVGGDVEARGLARLGSLWREERDGALSLAMSLAAFRLHGSGEATDVRAALAGAEAAGAFEGDTVAIAWAAIATGPGLHALREVTW